MVRASEARLKDGSELISADQTGLKATRNDIESAAVTKRLEEELLKRDTLIEVAYSCCLGICYTHCCIL